MAKPTIAFVVGQRGYDLFQRTSALDSILCSVLTSLSDEFSITVNGTALEVLAEEHARKHDADLVLTSLSRRSLVGRVLPDRLKDLIKDVRRYRDNKLLVRELAKRPRPDLVFELMRYGSEVGMRLADHHRVPLLAYFDAPAAEKYVIFMGRQSHFRRTVDRRETRTISRADAVIAYASSIGECWSQRASGVSAEKFRVFQALDYSRLTFNTVRSFSGTLTVGYIGSFNPWHKVDLLLEAFYGLRTSGHDTRLLLVGAGFDFESIRARVRASPHASDIEMTGFVDGAKLEAYKQRIDIGVYPSAAWYNMPTKAYECGAAGMVAAVPRTRTTSDLFVDGIDSLMFENGSLDELHSCLERFFPDRELCRKQSIELQEKVRREHTAEHAHRFYRELILELVGARGGEAH